MRARPGEAKEAPSQVQARTRRKRDPRRRASSVRDPELCRQFSLPLVCFCFYFCHCIGKFFHFLQCFSVYPCSYTHKHTHSHTYTHTHAHIHIYIYIYMYACMPVFMHVYICAGCEARFVSCRSNLTLFSKVSYMYNALHFSMSFCFFLHLGSSERTLRAFFNITITFSG